MKNLEAKIYFIKDVEDLTGRSRTTLRRWWDNGLFPKPVHINSRVAWSAQVIEEWIKNI